MCKSLRYEGLETRKLMTADIGMSMPLGEADQVEARQVGNFEHSAEIVMVEPGETENRSWDTGGTAEPPVIYTDKGKDKDKESKEDDRASEELKSHEDVEANGDGYHVDSFTLNYSRIDV